ncbi:ankyrin repeat and SAM domain-containing protein 6-like [Bradysia coprophila]|uniref:ankyrin repeat and SAM domain-containing protein 6-like n=1 Tax=Bradysia coprophila TaxID=38358 RepID=UPI00187D76BF|nr:ankyrin repeat and SAM domain-containing protein 6-like [Bradysia coprophila]XP_037048537.1 ankyrin repeat and SAM domain-containing protein 6-like [Bradysia coprophila]
MYHPRVHNLDSPLTPIPAMSQQSPFNFSPTAVDHFLEASNSPAILHSLRTTPILIEIPPPDISPIEYVPGSANRFAFSPNSSIIASNHSLSKNDGPMPFYLSNVDKQNGLNDSNINNHHLDISSVLDEIGLEQYKSLLYAREIDLKSFMMLTDGDLQEMGIEDKYHRLVLAITINNLNNGFSSV